MTILIWRVACCAEEYTESFVENGSHLVDDLGMKSLLCVPTPPELPAPILVFTQGKSLPDFAMSSSFFIVSERLKLLIEQFEVHGEFIRCKVRHEQQIPVTKSYFFFNILDAVECFDFERSAYQMSPHGVDGIDKLVLVDDAANGKHLFRIGQMPSTRLNDRAMRIPLVCASDELATAVISAGCTGVRFVLPEHFNDYPPEQVAWSSQSKQ
jgi:hypothetical protein